MTGVLADSLFPSLLWALSGALLLTFAVLQSVRADSISPAMRWYGRGLALNIAALLLTYGLGTAATADFWLAVTQVLQISAAVLLLAGASLNHQAQIEQAGQGSDSAVTASHSDAAPPVRSAILPPLFWRLWLLGVLVPLLLLTILPDDPFWRMLPAALVSCAALLRAAQWNLTDARDGRSGLPHRLLGAVLILWALCRGLQPFGLTSPSLAAGLTLLDIPACFISLAVVLTDILTSQRQFLIRQGEIVRTRAESRSSRRQLDVILHHLADGVLTVDQMGRITSVNLAAEKIFGASGEALVGQDAAVLLPDPANPAARAGLLAGVGPDGVSAVEYEGRNLSTDHPVLLELAANRLESNRATWTCVVRDVTHRRISSAIDSLVMDVMLKALQGQEDNTVLPFLCRRLARLLSLRIVWIGAREPDGSTSVAGYAGDPEARDYLQQIGLRWDDHPMGRGPSGRAIREGTTQILRPDSAEWNDLLTPLRQRGLTHAVVVPLRAGPLLMGALNCYSDSLIDEPFIDRLEELAARLAISMEVMQEKRRLRLQGLALGSTSNAMIVTDPLGRVEWSNEAFCRLSGYTLSDVQGEIPAFLRADPYGPEQSRTLWESIEAGRSWQGEVFGAHKNGSTFFANQTVTPMCDSGGLVSHLVVVLEDITDRKNAEAHIRLLSSTDALTGLPNASQFRTRLQDMIDDHSNQQHGFWLMILTLDRSGHVHDLLGHDGNNRLLTVVARRLEMQLADGLVLARVGGDEFAVMLPGPLGRDQVAVQADMLIRTLVHPFEVDGHVLQINSNIGIAACPENGSTVEELINVANMAMHNARRTAHNLYVFYHKSMNQALLERIALQKDMERALHSNEFILYYQPQMSLVTHRLVGMEALIRWNHPDHGQLLPGQFIPFAEETGLISALGDLSLRIACRQIREWLDQGLIVPPVAVNLSPQQLHKTTLVERIEGILKEYAIPPSLLELELTETSIMQNAEGATIILDALNRLGIRLAIDDFGTGYSSLSYLRAFPVSKLKIDKSFVNHLGVEGHKDRAIARAIITLGHSLGLKVVSEGVETPSQMAYLQSQHCDLIQGHLFHYPLPAADLAELLPRREQGAA